MDLMGLVSHSINMAMFGKRVLYIQQKKFNEEKMFQDDEFYEIFDPEKNYYSYEEKRSSQLIVKRDFGGGMKQYYFELRIIKLIRKKEVKETLIYITATEYLTQSTINLYKKYCQCCKCRKNRGVFRIVPDKILIKICHFDIECICLKENTYDSKLLKLTRKYYLEKTNK
jgi:hypothetical protein